LDELGATDALYHYNILRPLDLKRRYELRGLPKGQSAISKAADFDRDPQWNYLTRVETAKKAVVLVAGRQTILQRIRQRQVVESPALMDDKDSLYPTQQWLDLIEQVDLVALYRAWCGELRSRDIPYTLVDSSNDAYQVIESEDRLPGVVNDVGKPGYTKAQIKQILRKHSFRYHRVELPFGLHTKGADRSATRDLIFPKSLTGKTVLDAGCALGYFCFEAEAKGAARVVGVEVKEERFRDALLLKDIKSSEVEFLKRDVILEPLDEHFDYVLLLNVIHHLKEPFRAIRQLASITRERLVIEFPTLSDRRFKTTANIRFTSLLNLWPLVGVSSLTQVDQTFVFTPAAIKRTLLDHERLFEKVDILRSPMVGRAIAVCHKQADPE
jgi:2-polyprenyl-3-methyl-5-hydroxy-6-metoxy-1,4-benzoquinol methylase